MAANRQLGYGGLGNTGGVRDFSGKSATAVSSGRPSMHMRQNGYLMLQSRGFRAIIFFLIGAL